MVVWHPYQTLAKPSKSENEQSRSRSLGHPCSKHDKDEPAAWTSITVKGRFYLT